MRRAVWLAALLMGCSIVNDPGVHQEGMDAGTGGADGSAGDGAAGDGGAAGIPLQDLCPMLAELYCSNAERCCMEGVMPRPAYDGTRCRNETESACASVYGLTATRSEIDYDPVLAADVLERGRALVEACDPNVTSFYADRDGLLGGIVGTVAPADECTPNDSSELEVSIAILSCAEGRTCVQQSATRWLCLNPAPDDEPCQYTFDCASGRCEKDGLLDPQHCGPGEDDGSACWRAEECASLACGWDAAERRFRCQPRTRDAVYCVYLQGTDMMR